MIPNYEGLVYRGVNLTEHALSKYMNACKQSHPVTENSFISTSKSRLIAMEYRGNVFFRIYSKPGKEIEKIAKFGVSNSPNVEEVLFRSKRKFMILEIIKQVDYTLITMEEI